MSNIYDYLKDHEAEIMITLERFVKAESPSNRKSLVDHCGNVLSELFYEHLSTKPEIIQQSEVGNHLQFSVGEGNEQILVVGHFDTVWEPGRLTYRVEPDRIYGPGILDMKAGIIQAMWAAKAIRSLDIELPYRIVFFCNSDEELGSPTSRTYIEEEARKSKAVFVVEPAEANTGALKTARKGIGMFQLDVQGVSAHAGNHHDRGASAIRELARQVEFLEGLTDYKTGTTVNVGVINGGTRRNVVPERAHAEIDVRIARTIEAERILGILGNLSPLTKGTTIKVTGDINRPPMERTPATDELFVKAKTIASSLGFNLTQASVGGGSDGNFTAALGVPTLDGLGAVGDGPHAEYEHILTESLVTRSALVAHLFTKV